MNDKPFQKSPYGSTPPEIKVKKPEGKPQYELEGWDDLNQWGILNHPQWSHIQRSVLHEKMSETDKLKLLAGEMLRLNVALMEQNIEIARMIQPSPLFIRKQDDPFKG